MDIFHSEKNEIFFFFKFSLLFYLIIFQKKNIFLKTILKIMEKNHSDNNGKKTILKIMEKTHSENNGKKPFRK